MTKNEYESAKAEIVKNLGIPVRGNGFETEDNESAKALNSLKGQYLASQRANKKLKAVNELQNSLEQAVSEIPEAKKQEYRKYTLPSIIVLDKDLKDFEKIEALIVKDYLENMDLEPKFLANKYGKSYQFVAGLLNSKLVENLRIKYYGLCLKAETMKSSLRAIKAGDTRVLQSAIEYLKLMSNSDESLGSKAISDPLAEAKLKELGDKLADA